METEVHGDELIRHLNGTGMAPAPLRQARTVSAHSAHRHGHPRRAIRGGESSGIHHHPADDESSVEKNRMDREVRHRLEGLWAQFESSQSLVVSNPHPPYAVQDRGAEKQRNLADLLGWDRPFRAVDELLHQKGWCCDTRIRRFGELARHRDALLAFADRVPPNDFSRILLIRAHEDLSGSALRHHDGFDEDQVAQADDIPYRNLSSHGTQCCTQ